jgi:protein tyrosine/serine phosphatase
MQERVVRLEGVSNFRDYGGYPTRGGARMKTGVLYRSANHSKASDADLEAIAKLGIGVVVDLRRRGERERDPSRRHPNFAGVVIDNDIGDTPDDPWLAFVRTSDLSSESFRGHGLGYYRDAPFEERHVDLYSRYFRALVETDQAVLIHCAAGKDRTGLLAALTHHLIGVHPDDIMADYLLTNAAINYELVVPIVTEMLAASAGRTPDPEAVRVAMGVHPTYLETSFEVIRDAHGDLDAYLERVLGVDAALRAQLERRLLA